MNANSPPVLARERKVLSFLARYLAEHGRPPTRLEIGREIGTNSTSVASHYLDKLQRKGLITIEPGTSRNIRLVSQDGGCPTCGRPWTEPSPT